MNQSQINKAYFWYYSNESLIKPDSNLTKEAPESIKNNPENWSLDNWNWFFDQGYFAYELQLTESLDALWVHCSDGSTVGRFGKMGIDIHNSVKEQLEGAPQCLLCTHGQPTLSDWTLFKEKALDFWGIKYQRMPLINHCC